MLSPFAPYVHRYALLPCLVLCMSSPSIVSSLPFTSLPSFGSPLASCFLASFPSSTDLFLPPFLPSSPASPSLSFHLLSILPFFIPSLLLLPLPAILPFVPFSSTSPAFSSILSFFSCLPLPSFPSSPAFPSLPSLLFQPPPPFLPFFFSLPLPSFSSPSLVPR